VRKLPAFAFAGVAAAALAGTAFAAAPKTHSMDVPLPDGSVAHIEYVGNVAPKVTVAPRPFADAGPGMPWMMDFPSFAGFDRMIQDMMRRNQEVMRHTSLPTATCPPAKRARPWFRSATTARPAPAPPR
jgi:hypothetical protein